MEQNNDLRRYNIQWARIPKTYDPAEKPERGENDFKTFPEAWDLFTSLTFQEDTQYVELRDRGNGDRWEFTSGWLDNWPKKGRQSRAKEAQKDN